MRTGAAPSSPISARSACSLPCAAVEHERVELGVPRHPDAIGRGAERERALRLLVRAHEEAVDPPERVADGAEQRAVPRELRRVEAAVRERDANAGLPGGADEVRPDLGVLEDEQVGAERGDRAAGGAEEIVGGVQDHVRLGELLARHLEAAVRDRRDDDAGARQPPLQLPHHGLQGEEIAGAGAVQPDARAAPAELEPAPVEAEPLSDAVPELRVREQHGKRDDEERVARDDVDEVQGGASVGRFYSIRKGFVKIHGRPSIRASTR